MVCELHPERIYGIRLTDSEDDYKVLLRLKKVLGESFCVRLKDSLLSGFVVTMVEDDVQRLCPEDRGRVEIMQDEGLCRDCVPLLWRFMGSEYIDEFLTEGKLRLSTFHRCQCLENVRMDGAEGNVCCCDVFGRPEASFHVGDNAFLLCASLSPFAANPTNAKRALLIQDLDGLIRAITGAIREKGQFRVSAVVRGACSYSSRYFTIANACALSSEDFKRGPCMVGDKVYFMKQARVQYLHELEYRVLWLVDSNCIPEWLDVVVAHPEKYAQSIEVPDKKWLYTKY